MKPSIHIVGDGCFGTFLCGLLAPYVDITEEADIKLLAVPAHAYTEVAEKYQGAHLVNICSVQAETNKACLRYSDRVTGFHPLFGPRTPTKQRHGIVTHRCQESDIILDLFRVLGCHIIESIDGRRIKDEEHDRLMAQTHGLVLSFKNQLEQLLQEIKAIPEECLPNSFRQLVHFAHDWGDFPPGTQSSIESNHFLKF